jgi:hypothetical protein
MGRKAELVAAHRRAYESDLRWALPDPDVRFYREPDVGDYRLLCVGCHDVIWSYPYAMERRHIAAALAAADNHVCGQVAA